MKNFLIAFLVFLAYSIFGMWYYSCMVKGLCGEDLISSEKSNPTKKTSVINVKEGNDKTKIEDENYSFTYKEGDLTFKFPENIEVQLNKEQINFSDNDNTFKQSIFNFLNENQEKELIIIGLLNSAESSSNKQLGIIRAGQVKNMLTDFGVNPNRVKPESKQVDFNYDENGMYSGGVLFNFNNLSEEAIKAMESSIENKLLYSGFGSKEFAPDNTLQTYALELRNYLEKYPNKKAQIVGHTDNTGKWEANEWYGMERAKNVKKYLKSLGIDGNRLVASSKGESQPIASNASIEGRRKNRRIEIKVE